MSSFLYPNMYSLQYSQEHRSYEDHNCTESYRKVMS